MSEGRSSYSALNRMSCEKKGSVSLVVPMAIALPRAPAKASSLKTKSSIEIPLFTPYVGVEFLASPISTAPAFIILKWNYLLFLCSFKGYRALRYRDLNVHGKREMNSLFICTRACVLTCKNKTTESSLDSF